MWSLLIGCLIMLAGAVTALAIGRKGRTASVAATLAVWAGCLAAFRPVLAALTGRPPAPLFIPWSIPWGNFAIGLDALSAFFLLPLLIMAPLTALYGCAYLQKSQGRSWFYFNLLIICMILILAAQNGMLFLVAWETMAITSFLLVVTDDRHSSVRKAGWIYLVATHLGATALLVFFALLGGRTGSFDFGRICALGGLPPSLASVLFALALIGFGSKAGIFPMHVWMPEAYPAAPSHVAALMSAVMINTGIYGLLRALTFLGAPPSAAGWVLVIMGLASGLYGAAMAMAQNDLKRLLAYSSVENIGIIAMGLGAGLLGLSWQMPILTALGLGGALLHVLNHSLFKGLLFMGAGAVLQATGTRQMDLLGGLIKPMPWTGAAFLAGSAAISALPPFNGFVSEFLIYLAGVKAALFGTIPAIALAALLLGGLALIGGLAAAGFTKAAGLVFLGAARSRHAARAHEAGGLMRGSMALLAGLCLLIGLTAPWMLALVTPAVQVVAGTTFGQLPAFFATTGLTLVRVAWMAALFLLLTTVVFRVRRRLAASRPDDPAIGVTWDCGFAQPTARMQYTASSYSQPLADLLRPCLRTRHRGTVVSGYFPQTAGFATRTPDLARRWLFDPLFRLIALWLSPLLALQHGRIHLYVLYVAVVLIALLIWKGGV